MIVGTAGHIDHGKSALVRALTGVDTDRLPEEKVRGISIELGYAYLDVPGSDARLGFVDVPGHERLVRTMLAGATGVDFALLVVAADDGVMPQTREHLAVLSLLGLERGAVALTKVDRVDPARLAEVRAQVDALLAGTPLAGAPSFPASSTTGQGLDALRAALFEAARRDGTFRSGARTAAAIPDSAATHDGPRCAELRALADATVPAFRLAVDRSFTLTGIGTVVTGTVRAGTVTVGDELLVAPAPGRERRVRVRSLHAADRAVASAAAGERCALAVAGVDRDEVGRGQWLVDPAIALSTTRLDARITVWRDEPRPLRNGATVHVHLGTADLLASVAILEVERPPAADPAALVGGARLPGTASEAVAAGCSAWIQLVLRAPVATWHGDRLVLRDASATRTLAGGRVLDPYGPARHRRTAERLAELAAQLAPTAGARLEQLVEAAPLGVSLDRWARAEGVEPAAEASARNSQATEDGWRLAARFAAPIEQRALDALRAFHDRQPALPGLDLAALRRLTAPRLPESLWRTLVAGMRASGRLGLQASFASLPERAEATSRADATLLASVDPLLARAGREGAWVRDLARATSQNEAALRASLARLARQGLLHQGVDDLYWHAGTIVELATIARRLAAASDGQLTAAAFRDATGLGRKRAIQLLEYFDRVGLSRRVGDMHRLRTDTRLFEAG